VRLIQRSRRVLEVLEHQAFRPSTISRSEVMFNSTGISWSSLAAGLEIFVLFILLWLSWACICLVAFWCGQLLDCAFRNKRFEFFDSRWSARSPVLIIAAVLVHFWLSEEYLHQLEGYFPGLKLAALWYSFAYTIIFLALCLGAGPTTFDVFKVGFRLLHIEGL